MIMNIKILIATHRKYHMPMDNMYIPVRVGSALADNDFGYQRDDQGDNISKHNPYLAELTALYWGWKNLDADFIGLAHYRRHFSSSKSNWKFERVLSSRDAEKLCEKYDVILPKKRHYYIETLASHYGHVHDIEHLELTREILKGKYPEYVEAFDKVMKRTSGHMFNMCIMKRDVLNSYCTWLFDILFALEKEIDGSNLSAFDKRLYARVGELLMDVWLEHNNINYKDIDFVQIGDENWPKKIKGFLNAKFRGKKYDRSK